MININNGLLELDNGFIRGLPIKEGDVLRCNEIALLEMKCNMDITHAFNIIEISNNIPKNTFWNRLKKLFYKSEPQEIWYDIMFEKIR